MNQEEVQLFEVLSFMMRESAVKDIGFPDIIQKLKNGAGVAGREIVDY